MIAIIDDSRLMRDELKDILIKLHQTEIIVFDSGNEYVKKIKEVKISPEIVFLDGTLLNGLTGKETLVQIKKGNKNQIVVLYGGFQVSEVQDWIQEGVDNFISKRAEIEQVAYIINKYIKKHSN